MRAASRLRVTVLGLTLLAGPSLAFGATPVLVRDIDPHPSQEQGGAEQLVSVGDRAVFFLGPDNAPDHARLRELWTTDGTASGTERLRSFSGEPLSLGSNGRIAFFAVQSADFVSWQLWRTDGTVTGTFSFNVTVPTPYLPSIRTFYQNRLLFDGCTPQGGCELWASDGTAAGTRQVRDLTAGPASSRPHGFASAGGRLYFFADDPTGLALWTSDGSGDGTHRVVTLPPFARPMNPVVAGGRIFFLEGVPFHSTLWTSDGTVSGTRTVPPFENAGNRRPEVNSILGSLGGSLFFAGLDRFNSYQLWKTDGTPRGTLRLTSSPPVPPGATLVPTGGAALGDRFVFEGVDFRLWTTRGTRASTQRLAGCPGGCPLAILNAVSLVHDGKLFFAGSTPGSGSEPWVTDGTAAGTRRLGDFCPGSCGSDPNFVAVVLGRAFFIEGPRLWATDGTAAGTALLSDGGFLGALAAAGNRTVFTTVSENSGPGLAVTDGTTAGTQSLDVHFSHGAGSNPRLVLPIGNEVRFQTCDTAPAQVWTSDGTAGGTFALTGESFSSYCAPPAKLGSTVYFIGGNQEQSLEVWRGDGTPGGTFPITRLAPDRAILSLGTAGDRLVLFVQEVASGGTELWTSDGTEVGTVKVTDLPDRAPSFVAASPGGRPGEFFFQTTDAEGVTTFWFSDGTPAGTRKLLKPVLSGDFTGFTRFNDTVYFTAGNAGLWKTDGTPGGTRQVLQDAVTEIVPFAGALFLFDQSARTLLRSDGSEAGTNLIADLTLETSLPPDPQLTVAGGVLYFVSIDADHGAELWRTDGTRAGSRIVADVLPGAGSSSPAGLTAAGGLLYFTANDGQHGRELWVTDGTETGTRMVADLAAGPGSSSPMELTVAGDHLFFNADDGFTGRELWLLPLGPDN